MLPFIIGCGGVPSILSRVLPWSNGWPTSCIPPTSRMMESRRCLGECGDVVDEFEAYFMHGGGVASIDTSTILKVVMFV